MSNFQKFKKKIYKIFKIKNIKHLNKQFSTKELCNPDFPPLIEIHVGARSNLVRPSKN